MGIKKKYSLNKLFIKFLFSLVGVLILGVLVPPIIFFSAGKLGYINYANQGEKDARILAQKITDKSQFDKKELSPLNEYLVLTTNLEVEDSTMEEGIQSKAIEFAKSNENRNMNFIRADTDKQIVIISYKLQSSYANDFLNKYFISPEILLLLLIGMNILIVSGLWIKRFSTLIQKELAPINVAVKKIENNDLDFEVEGSNITELNQILESFDEMKHSLKNALEKRWKSEQKQRNLLAALVHDIKTPLTGAIGWTELLSETELNSEQHEFIQRLLKNQFSIEYLINSLMEVTLENKKLETDMQFHKVEDFGRALKIKAMNIAEMKNIAILYEEKIDQSLIEFDYHLLHQAVFNILSNAIDFTPTNGQIRMIIEVNDIELKLLIEDSGKGFTKEAMEHATEDLYMGDSSRSGINHFGMGLSIVKHNIEHLNGKIIIKDSEDLGGALVEIVIPT
ncbi:HAMP domain-containing histidine kinase [Listeria monocytogenes]|nr:HAMP domain-containing histidine kinase [Listeria monocytogenes]EII2166247.1 HAMP domain-containing histidine kinase [Listeria monocytogenes]EII2287565.1 HAMP domain-containing histidine kinase [Listeria monocytogenes]